MIKVITYGTYDLLHHGHKRLLERAKALGDYLIVGVTSDDYDRTRGKINASQSLMERIDAVKSLGVADEIIVEEYEGQKIDDITAYFKEWDSAGPFGWSEHYDGYKILGFMIVCEYDMFACRQHIKKRIEIDPGFLSV